MRNLRRTALSLVLAVALLGAMAVPAFASNPTVSITVSAQLVSITNSKTTWEIGVVAVNGTAYFSANNAKDNTWSRITNTGNVDVTVKISGGNFVAGNVSYNWVLAGTAGDQAYSLYANSDEGETYDVEVDTAGTNTLKAGLTKGSHHDWSMLFTAPTAFHVDDDGLDKSASVTLVTSKSL